MTGSSEIPALKLLVAVDGSAHADAAVHWVAGLKEAGLELHCVLLNVQGPIMSGEVGLISPVSGPLAQREQIAAKTLDLSARVLENGMVQFTKELRVDSPVSAIVACAKAHQCEAIVVGRRGRGAVRSALLGSVSAELVQRSSLPVIVVNKEVIPLQSVPLSILLACDGSEPATRAAEYSARLASRAADAIIHLLHAQSHSIGVGAILGPSGLGQLSVTRAEQALSGARRIIEQSGCTYTVHPVLGDVPGEAILHAADEVGSGMIAMGTRGLGPTSGLLRHSVTRHVLALARVPVLLAR